MKQRALIFGANGFVGPYLAEEFLRHGYEVYASDRLPRSGRLPEAAFYSQADIADGEQIRHYIDTVCPTVIINFAAVSSVADSWKNPQAVIEVNVIGALNILQGAENCKLSPKVLLVGSSEEYASSDQPLTEDCPLDGTNPYGISKIMQEKFSQLYRRSKGLKLYYARSFNHTGIGQDDRFALPSFCRQVAEIEKSGRPGTIRVGNLNVWRDFSDVRDVVEAYRLIVESPWEGMAFNVGSGQCHRMADLLDYVISLANTRIAVEKDPALDRPTDTPMILSDNTRLKTKLGWEAHYSIFDTLRSLYHDYLQL